MKITPEICETAIEQYVTPTVEAGLADGRFGRRDGALIVASVIDDHDAYNEPDADFQTAAVIYEHSWGRTQVDDANFSLKALQKVFGAWKFRQDYDKVITEQPKFVQAHGLIAYPGAVIRDVSPLLSGKAPLPALVAGYAGLWWWQ